ncbi:major facilitator superfamily domain-containing protein [Aspergillus cavernicola]|uniref:Major facilitator superfamily domain-containing protein n=1 Tax=Aspergillus cavernicola TaxID=176166 RepID=A0ABR4I4S1_9EURO
MFAFGGSTLVLSIFLSALGNSEKRIGIFMSSTLVDDVIISLTTSMYADRAGRRRVLALGSLLMAMSGYVFATSDNFWLLLGASISGVISPSGSDVGPFKAVEESAMAQLMPPDNYNAILAWYYMLGSWGATIGSLSCGWLLQWLQDRNWRTVDAYRCVFWIYAAMGLVKLLLSVILGRECESHSTQIKIGNSAVHGQSDRETEPLLHQSNDSTSHAKEPQQTINARTRIFLWKLCFVLILDSLGSGLCNNSWVVFFFNSKFRVEPGVLGSIFSGFNFLTALSNVLAIPSVRHIGLIKTMVLGHIVASAALLLLPVPSQLAGATICLLLRATFIDFHQPARQTFVSQSVGSEERTAVMGIVNVIRTLAQSPGPIITGFLGDRNKLWLSFSLAGGIKIAYNILLWILFTDPAKQDT